MIYKIVQGNSFKLHILVRKPDISSESNMLIDFDMTKATDIKVSLVCNFGESTIIPAHVSMALPNVVVCDVPSTLEIGNYNVSVSWRMDGNDMASVEKNLFRIVEYNSQAQYPICMVEGENCKETKIATAIVVLPATIELWQLVNLTNATLEEADTLSKKIADAEALRVDAEKKRESAELTRNKQVADAISNINKAQANNIKKIEQTTTSIESGGVNVITITTGNGTTSFEVRNGSKGEQGEKGEKGDKGEKGEKGEQGTQGIQGAKGDTGSPGERGLQGERGEKGDMGSIGKISISVDNTTGTPSATASSSKAADGSTDISFSFKGIKGENGEKGEVGMQGNSGVADASNKTLVNDAITGGETDFLSAEVGKLGILTYDCSKGGSVTHATLQEAINSVPTTFQKVGLTITYKSGDTIHRYTLNANAWSADPTNWFSVEDKLNDLVMSFKAEFSYKGIAQPTTNPGVPDGNVFYIAGEGSYPNFGNLSVAENEIAVLYFDGTNWSKQSVDFSSSITEIKEKANTAATDASNALKKAEAADKASTTNKQNLDNAVERIGTLEDSVNTINTNMPKMICMTETAYEALEKKEADTYYMLTEE